MRNLSKRLEQLEEFVQPAAPGVIRVEIADWTGRVFQKIELKVAGNGGRGRQTRPWPQQGREAGARPDSQAGISSGDGSTTSGPGSSGSRCGAGTEIGGYCSGSGSGGGSFGSDITSLSASPSPWNKSQGGRQEACPSPRAHKIPGPACTGAQGGVV